MLIRSWPRDCVTGMGSMASKELWWWRQCHTGSPVLPPNPSESIVYQPPGVFLFTLDFLMGWPEWPLQICGSSMVSRTLSGLWKVNSVFVYTPKSFSFSNFTVKIKAAEDNTDGLWAHAWGRVCKTLVTMVSSPLSGTVQLKSVVFTVNGWGAAFKTNAFTRARPFECRCFSDPMGQRRKWEKALVLINGKALRDWAEGWTSHSCRDIQLLFEK